MLHLAQRFHELWFLWDLKILACLGHKGNSSEDLQSTGPSYEQIPGSSLKSAFVPRQVVDCWVVWLLQPHLACVGSSLCPKDLNASKFKGTSPLIMENTQARQAHRLVWLVPRISVNTCPVKKVACHLSLRPYCLDLLLGLPSLAAMPWAGLHHCIMRTDC